MDAQLPTPTRILIAIGTTARNYVICWVLRLWSARFSGFVIGRELRPGRERVDRFLLKIPIAGEVWLKYQVAQFSRVLGTLLIGGIPLLQALDTAADSLGTQVLKRVLAQSRETGARRAVACRNLCAKPRFSRAFRST